MKIDQIIELKIHNKSVKMPFARTFGDVPKGKPLIFKDDYGRIEAAINMGNFSEKYGIKIGYKCKIKIEKISTQS